MANTTFSGPVRSIGGFQTITVNATTGAVATSATFGTSTSVTSLAATNITATATVTARSGVALTAGGAPGFIATTAANNMGIYFGSGVPTVSAAKGSLYLRSDGTTTNDRAYINTDGATAWTALTTVA
jgi:hypothetical protein